MRFAFPPASFRSISQRRSTTPLEEVKARHNKLSRAIVAIIRRRERHGFTLNEITHLSKSEADFARFRYISGRFRSFLNDPRYMAFPANHSQDAKLAMVRAALFLPLIDRQKLGEQSLHSAIEAVSDWLQEYYSCDRRTWSGDQQRHLVQAFDNLPLISLDVPRRIRS